MRVHNITDRDATPGRARTMRVAGRTVRAGKFVDIDPDEIGSKIQILHGSALWFGDALPKELVQPAPSVSIAKTVVPMTVVEAREYLDTVSDNELRRLAAAVTPSPDLPAGTARIIAIARIARSLFQEGRVLDPAKFFWLRRWIRQGDTYVEKE